MTLIHAWHLEMGGCQNYGPFLGGLNIACRLIIGIQKRHHNFDNHLNRDFPYIPQNTGILILGTMFFANAHFGISQSCCSARQCLASLWT